MKKSKISITAIISLLISIFAFVLYAMLLDGSNVFIPWILGSIAALCFPVFSKQCRTKHGSKGKTLEIIALILDAFDFYFVIFAATKWNIYIAYALIAIVCVLYAKLFNRPLKREVENAEVVTPTSVEAKPSKKGVCKECGCKFPRKGKFCPNCGAPLPAVEKLPRRERLRLEITLICIMIIAVLSLGAFGVHLMIERQNAVINHQHAVAAMNNQDFIAAQRYFDMIPHGEQDFPGEYAYVRAGVLLDEGRYLDALRAFDALEDVPIPASVVKGLTDRMIGEGLSFQLFQTLPELKNIQMPDSAIAALQANIYSAAQEFYRNKSYSKAKEYFTAIDKYQRSTDYLTLIAGVCEPWIQGDTYSKVVNLLGFEDANEIILNGYYYDFLNGKWKTENKAYYFELDSDGTLYNLPSAHAEGYYDINHGVYSVGDTKVFRFQVIDMDTITVYCYNNRKTYTLYRQ